LLLDSHYLLLFKSFVREILKLAVISDLHYAGPLETAGGHPRAGLTQNPLANAFMHAWDRWFWMRDPFAHNAMLDDFIAQVPPTHRVVANGDYSCDAACVGMADAAAFESASLCLGKLRTAFAGRLQLVLGDHELGKQSFIGGRGGLRLEAWHASTSELQLKPLWTEHHGNLVLLGVTSSLVGLELLRRDAPDSDWPEWQRLRSEHIAAIADVFRNLKPSERVALFCHDPGALPFLLNLPEVAGRMDRIESTVVGHLHSQLVFTLSRLLAGAPQVRFLGATAQRWSGALNRARQWKPFKPVLCPAMAGIELTGRGGWLELALDVGRGRLISAQVRPMPRRRAEVMGIPRLNG